jgi:hemoglobin-like flavoprotein
VDDQRQKVIDSLERAALLCPDLTPLVYEQLFLAQPHLAEKFVMDRNHAVRGEMLAKAFDAILDLSGPALYAGSLIHAEAINHDNNFGISADIFATFFPIVRDSVQKVLADEWSDDIHSAWSELLGRIDRLIQRADS